MIIKGLFIDIDDTILRFKEDYDPNPASLFNVIRKAGQKFCNLDSNEIEIVIEQIKEQKKWWCWGDFIKALKLDEKFFWEFAYKMEKQYLEACETNLGKSLLLLKQTGIKLFITSNNPNKGIKHKLSLAEIPEVLQNELFSDFFGATEMENMKWETNYWEKTICLSGIDAKNLAVIGDSFQDDYVTPQKAGVAKTFLIDKNSKYANSKYSQLQSVSGIAEIASEFSRAKCSVLPVA